MAQLQAPVGSPMDPKVKNVPEDVFLVRVLLVQLWARTGRPEYFPGNMWHLPNQPILPANDPTVKAIIAFQRRFMTQPDGRIDPGGKTWRKLSNPNLGAGPLFPFTTLPNVDWTSGMRRYAARRSGGKRLHAGCDIYFPAGTPIYAVDSGRVVKGPVAFYLGTDELCIYHDRLNLTLRYGEIGKATCKLRVGDTVEAGEPIAKVGKMKGLSITMLHLEIYTGSVIPRAVTKGGKMGKLDGKDVPFMRLKSLVNPTEYVNRWSSRFPTVPAVEKK